MARLYWNHLAECGYKVSTQTEKSIHSDKKYPALETNDAIPGR
jgi:hypothetical protein